MTIIEDTRQQIGKHIKTNEQLERLGIKILRSKLPCGDYANMLNMSVVIDSKKDLQECVNNICGKLHERFRRECQLAQDNGIKLIILVEHGGYIKSLESVKDWINPRQFMYEREIRKEFGIPKGADFQAEVAELKSHGAKIVRGPTTGEELYKAIVTMSEKYSVEWVFCEKKDTGSKIIELLRTDSND